MDDSFFWEVRTILSVSYQKATNVKCRAFLDCICQKKFQMVTSLAKASIVEAETWYQKETNGGKRYGRKKEFPACPVETTLTLIGNKWKVLILRDLLPGTKRFGELKKSIGHVSQKVLTSQLRQMEESGLITRTVYPEVPPRVEYALTELGYSLKPVLDAMWEWGEKYKAQNT